MTHKQEDLMKPEYIAMQAAMLRGFATEFGFNLPGLTDSELMAWFHQVPQPDYFAQKRQQWSDPEVEYHI